MLLDTSAQPLTGRDSVISRLHMAVRCSLVAVLNAVVPWSVSWRQLASLVGNELQSWLGLL